MARLFIFGWEEKGSGEHPIKFLFSKSPLFGDFVHGFPVVLNNRKGLLIGEGDIITLYCQPSQRLRKPFLSFNTNQKPRIKSPKCGDFENKKGVHQMLFLSVQIWKKKKQCGCARLRRPLIILQGVIACSIGLVWFTVLTHSWYLQDSIGGNWKICH